MLGGKNELQGKICMSLLLKGLHDPHLNSSEKALLTNYQITLLNLFQKIGSPSSLQVAELVTLAITENENQYRQIISNYLTFLQRESILEGYHLQGLADIVSLAQQTGWVTPYHGEQILSLLLDTKRNSLLNPANKDAAERYQSIALWQHILFVITEAGTKIQEDQKKSLQVGFKAYEDSFKSKTGNDEIGLSLVGMAKQSLLHVKDDSAPLWQRVGWKTLSAAKNTALSVAAIGAIPVTFGLSSLGAVAPGIEAIGDIADLIKDIYQHIKDKKNTQEWYQQLLNLRSLFILSVYYKKEIEFKKLVEDFIKLPDKQLKQMLAHGLLDTVTQILISWPDKEYLVYHQQCYELFKHWINTLDSLELESRLFAAMTSLMNGSKVNISFEGLWIEYLKIQKERFNNLGLTPEFIKGIQVFFLTIDRMKEECQSDPIKAASFIAIQEQLVNRLLAGYKENKNNHCLDALCALELDPEVKDKDLIKNGLTTLYTLPHGKELIEKRKEHLSTESGRPSLMLTVWVSLNAQKQKEIADIFKQYNVDIDVPREKAAYIFGEIDKLIVGIMIPSTGIVIHQSPKNKDEGEGLAAMIQGFQSRPAASHKVSLAEKVNFAFFGHYVEGLMVGSNAALVKAAERLAERYLSGEEQMQSRELESNTLPSSSSVSQPVRFSTSVSESSSATASQDDTNKEGFIRYVVEEKDGEEDHVVKINYGTLPAELAQQLQEILEGEQGIKAATHLGTPKKNRSGKYIIELRFEEQKAAELLQNALRSAVKEKSEAKLGK